MWDIRRKISGSGFIRSLIRNNHGAVAIYIAIFTPVMIGVGAMTVDIGRLITLHTELQYAADSASLAGARELDQKAGARARARAAAAGAVANLQTFATGGADVTIDTTDCADPPVAPCIRFLKDLPASDADPITALNLAATDGEAAFLDVHVGARAVTTALIQLVTFGSGPSTIATSASAVAGQQFVVCNIPLMFMCNPTEPAKNTDLDLPLDHERMEGKQMELFHQGAGGTLSPGNFGLLCPAGTEADDDCGGDDVKVALASTGGHCARLVTTKTGATLQMVRTGINARFDYFTQQAHSDGVPWRDQDKFVPAANVTQGGKMDVGKAAKCEYSDIDADEAMGLPRDQCHIDDDCEVNGAVPGNSRVGDGTWDYKEYFRINHRCDPSKSTGGQICKPADWDGITGFAKWPPTRFEVYRYELEKPVLGGQIVMPGQDIYDDSGTMTSYKTQENGHSQCFQGTPPDIPGYNYYPAKVRDEKLLGDRRVLPVAVLNCNALEASGFDTGGKFTYASDELAYVFLTEPMANPSNTRLYGEVLASLGKGTVDSLTRVMLQLYRR